MTQTAITQAIGALKLVPMYLNNPTIISRTTLIGASSEALSMLEGLPQVTSELAEVFRLVDSQTRDNQTAYVTVTQDPGKPYGAVVADDQGRLLATATGATKEDLAGNIRHQLARPHTAGAGEDDW